MPFKASAPGSLMLLGEYAVLYGHLAIICAIDKRITVTISPREDQMIFISSSLGNYHTHLSELSLEKPFQFILQTLISYRHHLKKGCDIEVTSTFSDQIGLGSSAAVTVATLAALNKWHHLGESEKDLVYQGQRIIQTVQGIGSGADIAASVSGGVLSFMKEPLNFEKYEMILPFSVWYSGFKTKTAEAIKQVNQHFSNDNSRLHDIMKKIGDLVLRGQRYLQSGSQKNMPATLKKLGEIMQQQQIYLESLAVSLPILRAMIKAMNVDLKKIMGAKISGSGLGDCIIGLGYEGIPVPRDLSLQGVEAIPLSMTLRGVECEEI